MRVFMQRLACAVVHRSRLMVCSRKAMPLMTRQCRLLSIISSRRGRGCVRLQRQISVLKSKDRCDAADVPDEDASDLDRTFIETAIPKAFPEFHGVQSFVVADASGSGRTSRFENIQKASEYLDMLRQHYNLDLDDEQHNFEQSKKQSKKSSAQSLVTVAVRVELPEDFPIASHIKVDDLDAVVGVGKGSSLRTARRMARIDLADRLSRLHPAALDAKSFLRRERSRKPSDVAAIETIPSNSNEMMQVPLMEKVAESFDATVQFEREMEMKRRKREMGPTAFEVKLKPDCRETLQKLFDHLNGEACGVFDNASMEFGLEEQDLMKDEACEMIETKKLSIMPIVNMSLKAFTKGEHASTPSSLTSVDALRSILMMYGHRQPSQLQGTDETHMERQRKEFAKTVETKARGRTLPIWALRERILETIRSCHVTIVTAGTGSGKTTQIPQFLLNELESNRSILITQPRRVAAITVADRVSQERNELRSGLGMHVGYSVRFQSRRPRPSVWGGTALYCTSGVLLRRLQRDPDLANVTHLILDEVHERDVNTDILLLLARRLLRRRPSDLKIILMSATMEAVKMERYFSDANFKVGTVLDIEGTNHPVEQFFLDDLFPENSWSLLSQDEQQFLSAEKTNMDQIALSDGLHGNGDLMQETSLVEQKSKIADIVIRDRKLKDVSLDLTARVIERICKEKPLGAVLVFLPGIEEITQLHELLLTKALTGPLQFHLLHSTIPYQTNSTTKTTTSSNEEASAFEKADHRSGIRKIVLATNLAESSVTIPDVVYVVDSTRQRVMFYEEQHRMDVLEDCWITRANMRQRLGRAGRCAPGEYYAMMSRGRVDQLPEQTTPEILRLSLDEVLLTIKASMPANSFESIATIMSECLDPPDDRAVADSVDCLKSLGALEEVASMDERNQEKLTPLGRVLANLPVHPSMGKMLITATIFKCLSPVLNMVAAMGERIFKPCRMPAERQMLAEYVAKAADGCFSDHVLANRILLARGIGGFFIMSGFDKNRSFQRESSSFNSSDSLVSYTAMMRIRNTRKHLLRELQSNLGMEMVDADRFDENAESDGLVRFILASGLYPDVALAFADKENPFRLQSVKRAYTMVTSSCSMSYAQMKRMLEEQKTPKDSDAKLDVQDTANLKRPALYVYGNLMDIGRKFLSGLTAIDPSVLMILASSNQLTVFPDPVNPQATIGSGKPWIVLTNQSSDGVTEVNATQPIRTSNSSSNDMQLLVELRYHWESFIKFIVSRIADGSGYSNLTIEERQAVCMFVDAMRVFADCTDFKQHTVPLLLKRSVLSPDPISS